MRDDDMANLTMIEKRKLERLFEMGSGYVLDFSNRTFAEFVVDSTGHDIDEAKYSGAGGSKANRLRAFWKLEPPHVVGQLIADMLDYCKRPSDDSAHNVLYEDCRRIAIRLREGAPVDALEAIRPEGAGRDFEVLASAVREHIEKNQPDAGLDRLHTFVAKLFGVFAERRGVVVDRDKPLHSVFGEYVKRLRMAGLIESEMTERILKSSISTLESFNKVRNTKSLAHNNSILNYEESLLIYNHVCAAVRFVRALESSAEAANIDQDPTVEHEIPF